MHSSGVWVEVVGFLPIVSFVCPFNSICVGWVPAFPTSTRVVGIHFVCICLFLIQIFQGLHLEHSSKPAVLVELSVPVEMGTIPIQPSPPQTQGRPVPPVPAAWSQKNSPKLGSLMEKCPGAHVGSVRAEADGWEGQNGRPGQPRCEAVRGGWAGSSEHIHPVGMCLALPII